MADPALVETLGDPQIGGNEWQAARHGLVVHGIITTATALMVVMASHSVL